MKKIILKPFISTNPQNENIKKIRFKYNVISI